VVPDEIRTPDKGAIRRDLEYMTRRWRELAEPAQFEIRAFGEGKNTQTALFRADWIEDAVEWVANLNALRFNTYAVRNPIRMGVTKSATDADILAAFFLWADCDEPAAAGNVSRFDGPKWSASVVTGNTPSTRVHVYWELDVPCTDLGAWRQMQCDIAAHFQSDSTVVNPSRIMRVGGTINWPAAHKRAKGYVEELCTIRTEYSEPRSPVTLEQMRRVFPVAGSITPAGTHFEIDAGYTSKTADELADMLRRARTDGEKHGGVRDLAAHLAGTGVKRELAEAIIRNVCPVWDRNVETLITSAYDKFWTPHEAVNRHDPAFDYPAKGADDAPAWRIQTAADFIADFVAPEYLIDGVVQRGRLYTLTAPTGSGKTAVMLYASVAIATGGQFCGLDVEGGDVLFLAGENPDDVRARFIATLEFFGIDPAKCRLHFVAGTFSIRADMQRLKEEAAKLPNLCLVVVDTFAAYFDGDDENSNAQALDFARVVRGLTQAPSKPAVIMPAHPVKNASKHNLAPKGGSSLVNEVDGNLTLWSEDGLITMHWQVKHRGPDFPPLKLELERKECDRLIDKNGRIIPTVLAKPVLQLRATQLVRERLSVEDQFLINTHDAPGLSQRERCRALGLMRRDGEPDTAKIGRVIKGLAKQKLIRQFRTKWELTKDGERAVSEILGGETPPAETDDQ
jgi:hypothetical protein